jgi:hypothetical protein
MLLAHERAERERKEREFQAKMKPESLGSFANMPGSQCF